MIGYVSTPFIVEKPTNPSFTRRDLLELYDRAVNYCEDDCMYEVHELYRCKPREYWAKVTRNHHDIMKPYIKDNSGHPGNNINGVLNGLFFSVNLNPDFSARRKSYFGNVKFSISIDKMLDPRTVHFYFCDFYCNYSNHHVTIVVCHKETSIDKYCNRKLKRLRKQNTFFEVCTSTNTLFVNAGIELEFFYTENVDVGEGHLKPIETMGRGTAYPGGLPNNKRCRICNF